MLFTKEITTSFMEVVISFFATLLHLHTINVHLVIVARKKKTESAKAKASAKELYIGTNMTQQEIADVVSVNTKTISRWRDDDGWETLKAAKTITHAEIIQSWMMQLKQLNAAIMKRPEGERYPSAAEADAQTKISNNISKLDKKLNIAIYHSTISEVADWMEKVDIDSAKQFMPLFADFMKYKISILNGNR